MRRNWKKKKEEKRRKKEREDKVRKKCKENGEKYGRNARKMVRNGERCRGDGR
jgi:hypothetical protein